MRSERRRRGRAARRRDGDRRAGRRPAGAGAAARRRAERGVGRRRRGCGPRTPRAKPPGRRRAATRRRGAGSARRSWRPGRRSTVEPATATRSSRRCTHRAPRGVWLPAVTVDRAGRGRGRTAAGPDRERRRRSGAVIARPARERGSAVALGADRGLLRRWCSGWPRASRARSRSSARHRRRERRPTSPRWPAAGRDRRRRRRRARAAPTRLAAAQRCRAAWPAAVRRWPPTGAAAGSAVQVSVERPRALPVRRRSVTARPRGPGRPGGPATGAQAGSGARDDAGRGRAGAPRRPCPAARCRCRTWATARTTGSRPTHSHAAIAVAGRRAATRPSAAWPRSAKPAPPGCAVVDEHRRLPGVRVQRGRHPADVPAVAGREQRQQPDRGVLGGVRRAGHVGPVEADLVERVLRRACTRPPGAQLPRRQVERRLVEHLAGADPPAQVADHLVGDVDRAERDA